MWYAVCEVAAMVGSGLTVGLRSAGVVLVQT